MDFVSLVTQGGLLWKAWVACHYERRLKRQDYLNADVKATCNYIIENVGSIPLRCLGHLMLGILRLLLRQAGDLENRAEEVRSALQFSLSTGPGLPTVPTVSAASVTLRHPGVVPVLDFGDAVPGLDMLMEPELPDLEVEASLEEGRRHVAPLATITLSSGPTAEPIVEIDDFGAPSAEDQASMAAVGQSALQMVDAVFEDKGTEPPASPPIPETEEVGQEAEPETEMEVDKEGSAAEVPPLDFLLGASSPGPSPARSLLSTTEGEGFGASHALAAEKAAQQAEAFAREAVAAAEEVAAIRQGEECSDLPPMDFLLRAAPEVSTSEAAIQMKMLLEPQKVAEEVSEILQDLVLPDTENDLDDLDIAMEPEAADAEAGPEALEAPEGPEGLEGPEGPEGRELQQQEEMQIVPRRKRRRRSIWFDEKTQISDRAYNNTSKITRANPFEYGIFLPHQSYHVGLTTAFGDICPLLRDPLRRASEIGARQRKARAEARVEADVPSPPRVPLAADEFPGESRASAEVPQPFQAEAQSEGVMQPLQEVAQESAAEGPEESQTTEGRVQPSKDPADVEGELSPQLSAVEDPAFSTAEERQSLPDPDSVVPLEAAQASEAEERQSLPDPDSVVPLEAKDTPLEGSMVELPPAQAEIPPEETSAVQVVLPPPKRQALQDMQGGSVVPMKVVPPQVQVKQEERIEVDLNKVSAKQGRELRASLHEDNALSFLGLCAACTAEAAACRFVDLLSLHMNGVVSLEQAKPYGDISIARGDEWKEWCDESKRGVKREAHANRD